MKTTEKEIWKDIPEHEGKYQASTLGSIRSLNYYNKKIVKNLVLFLDSHGYLTVNLYKNKKRNTLKVHQLIAMTFLDHKLCGYNLVINHKDFNKQNNRLENLEIVTARNNSNRKHIPHSSKYTGVYWHNFSHRWRAQIVINCKTLYLGNFVNEIDAHNAYQTKLKEIV